MAESDHNGATLFQAGAPARAARAETMGRTDPRADRGGQRERAVRRQASMDPGHSGRRKGLRSEGSWQMVTVFQHMHEIE